MANWSTAKNWIIFLLLALASTHCVQSIFTANFSNLNLKAYDNGVERMPFQGRIAMMPIGRWAATSAAMERASHWLEDHTYHVPEGKMESFSAEKFAFLIVAVLATLLAVAFGAHVGWRLMPEVWWLPSALFIYMLYATYGARSNAMYWYPYDMPHFAIYGAAAVCILLDFWPLAFCLFLVDLPVRETSIFLMFPILVMGYLRKQWSAIPVGVAMVLFWVVMHRFIGHRFAANPSDVGIHAKFWIWSLRNPLRWSQLASPFGFLVVPFIWGWTYLSREERFFALSMIPGILVTAVFGIWIETRIWDEWLLPAAVLLSLQATRAVTARFANSRVAVSSSVTGDAAA